MTSRSSPSPVTDGPAAHFGGVELPSTGSTSGTLSSMFERLHHMQLVMPPGQEATARDFYAGVLGMTEIDKPPVLAARGGAWFRADSVELHLGVEDDFRAARKGHPGILVNDLDEVVDRLRTSGQPTEWEATSRASAGYTRTTRSATASSSSSRSREATACGAAR